MKLRIRWKLLGLVAVILGAFYVYTKADQPHALSSAPTNKVAAFIKGEPLTEVELSLSMNRYRSRVLQYYQQTYGVELTDAIWNQEVGGRKTERTINEAGPERCGKS